MNHLVGGRSLTILIAADHQRREPSRPDRSRRIKPANVLATLYGHLGIDPAVTLPDHLGRPVYLLDDRGPVLELAG